MASPLLRVEVWSELQWNSGTALSVLAGVTVCQTQERFEGIVVVGLLTVRCPMTAAALTDCLPRRVLRLVFEDATWEEYRIVEVVDSTGEDGVATISARSPIYDLAERNTLLSETVSPAINLAYADVDTVSNLLTAILGFAPAYFALGTVTPTATVSASYDKSTALAGAIAVVEAANALTGTTYELSAVPDGGSSKYDLTCTVYNSAAAVPDIRTGKNLRGCVRTRTSRGQTTRVYPIGSEGGHIGDNWWKVTAVTLNTHIEVQDINGGLSPLLAADALNNLYVVDDADTAHQITDSVVVDTLTARLLMASTTNIAVGDWVRIALNSSKDALTYLDDAAAQASYGIQVGVPTLRTPSHTNWVKNGDLADWTGANPTDWTNATASPTKVTTAGYWLTGGQSARYQNSSGQLYQDRTVYMRAGDWLTYTAWLRIDDFGAGYISFRNPQSGADDTYAFDGTVAGLTQQSVWVSFSKSYQATSAGAKGCRVLFYGGGASCDVYLDAAQMSLTSSAAAFTRHSGGATNWLAGLAHLRAYGTPPVSYRCRFLDLQRFNATVWPYDAFVHGGTVNVTEPELGLVVSPRLVAITRDHLNPLASELTLSTRRSTLTSVLAEE